MDLDPAPDLDLRVEIGHVTHGRWCPTHAAYGRTVLTLRLLSPERVDDVDGELVVPWCACDPDDGDEG